MSTMYTKIILCIVFKMGAYHTLDLEVNRKFTLTKSEWDSVALERVDTACDPTQVCNITLLREYCYI
jgi:stalled ribosome rescue protein Dom34